MIGWRALLDGAEPLQLDVDESFASRAIQRLKKKKLALRVEKRFAYPNAAAAFTLLKDELQNLAATNMREAAILAQLLWKPQRAYVLRGADSEFALIGAYEITGHRIARIAVLHQDEATGDLTVDPRRFAAGDDAEVLLSALEKVYSALDRRYMPREPTRKPRDRVLWIGGSIGEADDEAWRDQIEACLGARGFQVTIRERPAFDVADTKRTVNQFDGAAVVCWEPRIGHATLAHDLEGLSAPSTVITLAEYQFEDALEELRLTVDSEPLGAPAQNSGDSARGYEIDRSYYFKKIGSGGGKDKMTCLDGPCGHNAWNRVHKAPQAFKGIEHLTGLVVRTLDHCPACTGMGMWKATLE